MIFSPSGNSDHTVASVSIDFPSNTKVNVALLAYDYSRADWGSLRGHLRGIPWEDIFKLGVSAGASEFREWVEVLSDGIIFLKPSGKMSDGTVLTVVHDWSLFSLFFYSSKDFPFSKNLTEFTRGYDCIVFTFCWLLVCKC